MNKKILSLVIAVLMSIGGSALAQDRTESPRTVRTTPPTQNINFNDELVQTSLVRPDQTTVRGGPQRSSVGLLRVRNHFVQEMFKSVENL